MARSMATVTRERRPVVSTDLAARIQQEHEAAQGAYQSAVVHAMMCGELLIEAKRQHGKHGRWTKWLADNVNFSERLAQCYMQMARLPVDKRNAVADLPLREALSAIHCRQKKLAGEAAAQARRAASRAAYTDHEITPARIIKVDGTVITTTVAAAFPHRQPTPEEIADELIQELAFAFYSARDTTEPLISIDHLRAAFERWVSQHIEAEKAASAVSN
jgi:hypothetical protein